MKRAYLTALFLLLVPLTSMAHPGHDSSTFMSGYLHPLTGIDHLLVILAVGFWAARTSRQMWQLPSIFIGFMLIGLLFGAGLQSAVFVEWGILASLFTMAVVLMLASDVNNMVKYGLTSLFALFHGMAHGNELVLADNALAVIAGMLLSSSLLIVMGVYFGKRQGRVGAYFRNIIVSCLTFTGALFLLS